MRPNMSSKTKFHLQRLPTDISDIYWRLQAHRHQLNYDDYDDLWDLITTVNEIMYEDTQDNK